MFAGILLHIPVSGGEQYRMGGSALAQVFQQTGDVSPDLDDPELFVRAFQAMQQAVKGRGDRGWRCGTSVVRNSDFQVKDRHVLVDKSPSDNLIIA